MRIIVIQRLSFLMNYRKRIFMRGFRFSSKKRIRSLFELIFITLVGTLIGVALFGHGKATVGPLQTVLSLQPTFTGSTLVELGPLGEISFASHSGLVRVKIEVKSMTPALASELVVSNSKIDKLKSSLADNLRNSFIIIAAKASIAGAVFSFIFMLLAFRNFKRSLLSFILSLLISGAVATLAYLSYQPQAILQPVYRGLIQAAPSLIGSAKDIADNFDKYRDQMASLLSNVTALYNAGENLQDYTVPDDSIKVLHISDLHLNPQGWDMVKLLTKNFKVSVIVDTGDISDHGTVAEDPYLEEIGKFKIPYIYVRGNHDSMHTQEVISKFPNAHVLDNSSVLVNGLTFAGVGDPRFTPDKRNENNKANDLEVVMTARNFANYLRGAITGQSINPDLILVHDPAMAKELLSLSPLILAGHLHHRSSKFLDETTQLMVQGSTGGSGLRALSDGKADLLEATILFFDSDTKKLIAYNNITMSGLGYADVKISRHLS